LQCCRYLRLTLLLSPHRSKKSSDKSEKSAVVRTQTCRGGSICLVPDCPCFVRYGFPNTKQFTPRGNKCSFCDHEPKFIECDARRLCYSWPHANAYAIVYPKGMEHLEGKGRDNSLLTPAAQAVVESHAKSTDACIVKTAQGAVLDGALKGGLTLADAVDVRCTPFLSCLIQTVHGCWQ
jgi:hypothetical protein